MVCKLNAMDATATVKEERMWAMLAHLSAFLGHFLPGIGNIVAPLVIWILKKDEFPLVDDQGKEALNFQISMTIYYLIAGALCFVLIGIPILIGLGIFNLIIIIVAAVKANDGVRYRYPFTIRFIS
ncbi:MAG: uncharacterized protein QOD99_2225 [Chthoniobacter sp.]|jgi:uncharacterized Tic20 family protein|nr:uncharacterized protein [Chthoniobacter sp.]